MIPTPTPFVPDGNYTISPWTDYYLQTMNQTIYESNQDMLAVNTAVLVCLIFIIGLILTYRLRRMFKYG